MEGTYNIYLTSDQPQRVLPSPEDNGSNRLANVAIHSSTRHVLPSLT
jgi:hypothetical protein